MRLILIVLISFLPCIITNSMDAPAKSLPYAAEAEYKKEEKRFLSYNLSQHEKLLEKMRKEFGKDTNPRAYLQKLQLFASGLLCQHILMEYLSKISYLKTLFQKSKEHYDLLLHRLKGRTSGAHVVITPENDEQLNFLLAHMDLIEEARVLSPEEIAIIFSWILDPEKGTWINTVGRKIKTLHESALIKNQMDPILKKKNHLIFSVAKSPILGANESLFDENLNYLFTGSQNLFTYLKLKVSLTADEEKLAREHKRNDTNISDLYRKVQSWYQKLYALVRTELYDTFKQLLAAGQKNLAPYLLPLPEIERNSGTLPSTFPTQLQTIPEPETIIPVPSLDTQLEKAREIWEKEHAQTVPKKKIKRKKRTPFVSFSSIPETAAHETGAEVAAPIVKKGDDGSYIEQDDEDDLKITIQDPVHGSSATIFKTKSSAKNSAKLKSLPKINYTRWVNEWFEDPEQAIITQGYKDLKNPRFRAGQPDWMPIVLHAFPKLVDEYIYQYGTVSETPSRKVAGKNDIMITIPGKMEYPNGNEETGIFTYIIDPVNGQWYHRMFTPSSHKKMAADFMEKGYFAPEVKGYYDVYFPPLGKP